MDKDYTETAKQTGFPGCIFVNFHSLKVKIIASSAACIILVGVVSNFFLYFYLTSIITEKADSISRLDLASVQNRLNDSLARFENLGVFCASDADVARGMWPSSLGTPREKRDALRAQETLKLYLSTSQVDRHITKLMAFNGSGLTAQAVTKIYSEPADTAKVRALPLFETAQNAGGFGATVDLSVSIYNGADCLALLCPIYDTQDAWIYIEMDMGWLREVIEPYGNDHFFVEAAGAYEDTQTVSENGLVYKIQSAPLRLPRLTLYSRSDVTVLSGSGGRPIVYTVMVVVITSLVAALVLAFLLSSVITRPLGRLMNRIQKIAGNDLSFDPAIERGRDEIAETGRMVNEMSGSIRQLLIETEEMYKKQKNSDIALLQSQVNPHFLYNTLDSIQWMASIQKNTGIMTMTRGLSSLLKNLAKGVGDKITLDNELALLQEYVNIQSIRYMESFSYVNHVPQELRQYKIVKLTLQPLVENAIFHGIAPKEGQGSIMVDAREDGAYLLITIRDDGVGMTPEETETMLRGGRRAAGGLSGIGVSNVNERLRLVYGPECGLFCVSVKGEYTEMTVKIPKEGAEDV